MKKAIISCLSIYFLISINLLGISAIYLNEDTGVLAQKKRAPDFTLYDIYNNSFTLSDHRGKVVLINFMALDSHATRIMMEELDKVYEEVGDEIVMISIDVWYTQDTKEEIEMSFYRYIDKWIFALDTREEDVMTKYWAIEIPMICIIDTNGYISYSDSGVINDSVLLEEIDRATIENVGEDFLLLLFFEILSIVIIILTIAGVFLYIQRIKSKETAAHYSSAQPISPCLTCGQPLNYVSEHQKWYCSNCKKFV